MSHDATQLRSQRKENSVRFFTRTGMNQAHSGSWDSVGGGTGCIGPCSSKVVKGVLNKKQYAKDQTRDPKP